LNDAPFLHIVQEKTFDDTRYRRSGRHRSVLVSTAASAQLELAKQKNCLACHYGRQEIGRARIKDVAKKYENDKDAEPRLAKKVREGGVGRLGPDPDAGQPAGQPGGVLAAGQVGSVA